MSLEQRTQLSPCAETEHNAYLVPTDVCFGLNLHYASWSPVLYAWSVAGGAIVKTVVVLKGGL